MRSSRLLVSGRFHDRVSVQEVCEKAMGPCCQDWDHDEELSYHLAVFDMIVVSIVRIIVIIIISTGSITN